MKHFTLLLSVMILSSLYAIADEETKPTHVELNASSDLSGYIVDDGSGVINNQHTEQNSTKPEEK